MRRRMRWLPALAGLTLVLASAAFLPATAHAWGRCGRVYYAPQAVYYSAYYAPPIVRPVVSYYRAPVVVARPWYGYSPYAYGDYRPYGYGAYYSRGPSAFFYGGW